MAQHKFTPFNRSRYRYWVGIDTGVETGYAEWDRQENKLICAWTVAIHTAMELIRELPADKLFVRVEDARLRKWIPAQATESGERGRREGAGSVKRDARIWEDFLTDLGIDFELVAPKANRTKMRADPFRKLTRYKPVTTSHGRDAAMLVFGY